MPWLACPDLQKCKKLAGSLSIMAVPTLIIFSPGGQLITRGGVSQVLKDPKGVSFPWEGTGDSKPMSFVQKFLVLVLVALVIRTILKAFM
jgi:hypothetical protein